MSLINQMLKDLDQRQANHADNLGQIKAVNMPVKQRRLIYIMLLLGLISASALAGLWWQKPHTQPRPIIARSEAVAPIPTLVPAPAPAPAGLILTQELSSIPLPKTSITKPDPGTTALTTAAITQTAPSSNALPSHDEPKNSGVISKQIQPLTQSQLAENTYRKAISLMQQGRTEDSINELNQSLAIDPHHHQARLALVGLLVDAKRNAEAERQLQQALTLDPAQTDTSMILARIQADRGGNNEAIKTLERGLPNAENQADYQALLATLLQRTGQNKAAIDHYLAALRYAPQSGTWWIGLGIAFQADGQQDKARTAFLRARATNSLNADLTAYVDQQLK